MSNNRIVFQNWIVDLGRDPLKQWFQELNNDEPDEHLKGVVSSALKKLNTNEYEFIIQFYYMGKSYREISDQSGRAIYKLEALHKRALKKLEALLMDFVSQRFEIKNNHISDCPICNSENSEEINEIIKVRNPEDTWRPILRIMKKKYGINIRSPQTLIGHSKYHIRSMSSREAK